MSSVEGTNRYTAGLAVACLLVSFVYALLAGYRDGQLIALVVLVRSIAGYGLGLLLAIILLALAPLKRRLRAPFPVLVVGGSLFVVALLAVLDLWEQLGLTAP